jgi:hypothetical protein
MNRLDIFPLRGTRVTLTLLATEQIISSSDKTTADTSTASEVQVVHFDVLEGPTAKAAQCYMSREAR